MDQGATEEKVPVCPIRCSVSEERVYPTKLTVSLTDRFRRCCRDLGREERAALLKSLLELDRALEDPHGHRGTGLRKLPDGVWELRVGLALRALFYLEKEEATFLFLGTHDEVRRFVRNA